MKSKQELRHYFLKLRADISAELRYEQSIGLQKKLLQFLPAEGLIATYFPIKSELDIMPINLILAEGARLVLPFTHKDFTLSFYQVKDMEKDIEPDDRQIPAPIPGRCLQVDPEALPLILVPGVAFDRGKYRLGYGKGCYDRLLKMVKSPMTIGVTFDQFLVSALPHDSNDIPVKKVLTPGSEIA